MTDGDALVPCVGAVVHSDDGRLLLVQRANAPAQGLWSVPGGRCEAGEDDATAIVREMREETGLLVRPGRLIGRIIRGPYAIADYECTVLGGMMRAGDDAMDARWCDLATLDGLPLADGLRDTLAAWGVLPRR